MKIVAAPQAFKGTLSAGRAADAIAEAARAVYPHADVVRCPVADGGDGTLEALVEATGGVYHTVAATGPLGEPVTARLGRPRRRRPPSSRRPRPAASLSCRPASETR